MARIALRAALMAVVVLVGCSPQKGPEKPTVVANATAVPNPVTSAAAEGNKSAAAAGSDCDIHTSGINCLDVAEITKIEFPNGTETEKQILDKVYLPNGNQFDVTGQYNLKYKPDYATRINKTLYAVIFVGTGDHTAQFQPGILRVAYYERDTASRKFHRAQNIKSLNLPGFSSGSEGFWHVFDGGAYKFPLLVAEGGWAHQGGSFDSVNFYSLTPRGPKVLRAVSRAAELSPDGERLRFDGYKSADGYEHAHPDGRSEAYDNTGDDPVSAPPPPKH
jgi:hypothetical protein